MNKFLAVNGVKHLLMYYQELEHDREIGMSPVSNAHKFQVQLFHTWYQLLLCNANAVPF